MALIKIFSKLPSDVEFTFYNINDVSKEARGVHKVVINGTNTQFRKHRVIINDYAETMVEESVWNAIVAQRSSLDEKGNPNMKGDADCLLRSEIIFKAKSENDAKAIIFESKDQNFLSKPLDANSLNKKNVKEMKSIV
jgi:hypothetical protein